MDTLIKIKDLDFYYPDTPNYNVLKDIDLEINEKDYFALIGPNGGGKSSLLKCILGLEKPTNGEIILKENLKIGYVPQFLDVDKKFPIKVKEVVLSGRIKKGLSPFFRYKKEDYELLESVLLKTGLTELKNRQISQLSGGEFQKMMVARSLISSPDILILDEPTSSTDENSSNDIYKLLKELNDSGMTIIVVTHDAFAISKDVSKIGCLNQTLFLHVGKDFTKEEINKMYGTDVDVIEHNHHHHHGGENHD